MAKTIFLYLLLSTVSLALCGQVKPSWTSAAMREISFPAGTFFTGYTQGEAWTGETIEAAKLRLLRDAQGLLAESIRMTISSRTAMQTVSTQTNRSERIDNVVDANVEIAADAEIAGMNSEPPFQDTETGIIHAFAYVNRFELSGYHKANLGMNLTQAEGLLQTAHDLEAAGEKSQARRQCEAMIPLLVRVRQSQDLLTAIEPSISPEALQQPRTEALHNRLVQIHARLAQAVNVYVESAESLFSRPTSLVANRLKSLLADMGCSFTDDTMQTDFRLKIEATTRYQGIEYGFTVCYADVTIDLFDARRERSVFKDEFSQKGISTTQEAAGRKALEDAAATIADKIAKWIE